MDPDYGQRRITRSVSAEAGPGLERDIGDVSAPMKFATMFLLSAFVIGPDISGGNRAPVELSARPSTPSEYHP
jgi:hypothetical protein